MSGLTQRTIRGPRDIGPLEIDPLTQCWTDSPDGPVRAALRYAGQVPVVVLGGEFDKTIVEPARLALQVVLRARPRYVVLDLTAVTGCEPACVPLLVALRRACQWHGAQLWLVAVPTPIRAALAGLGTLEDFPTERTAARAADVIAIRAHRRPAGPGLDGHVRTA